MHEVALIKHILHYELFWINQYFDYLFQMYFYFICSTTAQHRELGFCNYVHSSQADSKYDTLGADVCQQHCNPFSY